ncbi:MAG: DUF1801 domain-containing protein [Chitinophagaceae bacterium]|nr:DUF1801 domain-containing protein [Chitinophagaceae bacterium]MCW5929629.1 DUF1801 domain-containing protein [Chitinophagaceae bacterium]
MQKNGFSSVDGYIDSFSSTQKKLLKEFRSIIKKAAPGASEVISYQMPTFKLNKNLVHFAAYDKHIGFYPGPDAIVFFAKALKPYKTSKGAIQFSLEEPLPARLITDIVKYRVAMDTKESSPANRSATEKEGNWDKELALLKKIIKKSSLTETVKWGIPAFTHNGKNVLGLAGFKNHFTIWFYNGVFLKDKYRVLVNAQEGKTKSMRQWRFTSMDEIDEKKVLEYISDAISVEEKGLKITPEKFQPAAVPELLANAFAKTKSLKAAFDKLTPGRQKEYILYLNEARQEATKLSRVEKIKPMILQGVGLHDKYK